MSNKMEFDGSMIRALENQLDAYQALGELYDNAAEEDVAATRVDIAISKGSMTVTDNGSGCDDPKVMANPYRSLSRYKPTAIGVMGIGAKYGMAAYGRHWLIQTVTRGSKRVYRRLEVIWNEDGPLPLLDVTILPVVKAPAEIRNGGTRITVTGRQPGHSYNFERICRTMEKAYRPVLGRIATTIRGPDANPPFVRQLRDVSLDNNKFVSPPQILKGIADGRGFTVRYGVLKKPDEIVRGCNLIFVPRVLESWGNIGKSSLPSSCYVDVILGPQWKKLLRTTKVGVRGGVQLDNALEELLGDWIRKQQAEAANIRIELIMGLATANINSSILFLNKKLEGDYGTKPRKKPEPRTKVERPKPDPDRVIVKRRTRAYLGNGKWAAEADKPGCLLMQLVGDRLLGHQLYKTELMPGQIVVSINTGPEQRFFARAAINDGKTLTARAITEATRIGFIAYAEAVGNFATRGECLPVFAALSKIGYDIDESDDATDVTRMVMNFFYDQMAAGKFTVIEGGDATKAA